MSCMLRIIGEELDVDALDARMGMESKKKSYKGQPKFKTKPDKEKLPHSSLSFVASNAGFNNFEQQVKEVIAFLQQHYSQLQHIAETSGVDHATLDFGVDYQDSFVQSHYFPPELVKLCGELGLSLELSVYTSSDE